MRKVPESNRYKKQMQEIVKLCEKAASEYGEEASFFHEGVQEEEMTQ